MDEIKRGTPREKATIRTPVLTFSLIRWDWEAGARRDKIDISHMVVSSQWQKSIKTPTANCTLITVPQYKGIHLLDYASTMDVIEIREFGRLVFHGYIRRISASGSINPKTGAPTRVVTILIQNFGGLFLEGQLGVNMFIKLGNKVEMSAHIETFSTKMSDILNSGKSFADIVGLIIEEWFKFLELNGASTYRRYIDEWMDLSTGLSGKIVSATAKDIYLFNASDQQMSLWSVLQKIIETPFNEMWFDNGAREVFFESNASLSPVKPGIKKLSEDKTYLVLRQTPFNGTVINGTKKDIWDVVPIKIIPLNYLTKWDLSKSMEESYSFYLVTPGAFNPGEIALITMGIEVFDEDAFNKYLYKPLIHNSFYSRKSAYDKAEVAENAQSDYLTEVEDRTNTLKNWFEKNDQYLSGSLTIQVPKNAEYDPKIGERIQIEGIDGTFYVEAITHIWQYQGTLTCHVTVTRGYGTGKAMELKDKIFKRGKFVMDEQWSKR